MGGVWAGVPKRRSESKLFSVKIALSRRRAESKDDGEQRSFQVQRLVEQMENAASSPFANRKRCVPRQRLRIHHLTRCWHPRSRRGELDVVEGGAAPGRVTPRQTTAQAATLIEMCQRKGRHLPDLSGTCFSLALLRKIRPKIYGCCCVQACSA
jgi:hypothetical protein